MSYTWNTTCYLEHTCDSFLHYNTMFFLWGCDNNVLVLHFLATTIKLCFKVHQYMLHNTKGIMIITKICFFVSRTLQLYPGTSTHAINWWIIQTLWLIGKICVDIQLVDKILKVWDIMHSLFCTKYTKWTMSSIHVTDKMVNWTSKESPLTLVSKPIQLC